MFGKFVTDQFEVKFNGQRYLKVVYSDGSSDMLDLIQLGVQWFMMSNDAFADKYGIDFTPQKYNIYDECREIANNANLGGLSPLA